MFEFKYFKMFKINFNIIKLTKIILFIIIFIVLISCAVSSQFLYLLITSLSNYRDESIKICSHNYNNINLINSSKINNKNLSSYSYIETTKIINNYRDVWIFCTFLALI